ncbi:winged helix-turn-helix domain-containing protein [Croceibacterium mercuriale]|uniref:winged helix-turn-helix domain-containing protein n=1 Tax=Croceibacterium mercuriale TaxID=1572751 RepID=UPI000A9C71F2|nr:winged helix-turn-helix domain-containing protein [Croceibacterium mercuriale]
MEWFCWNRQAGDLPHRWDLRRRGWQLCRCCDDGQPPCSHVTLHDGPHLPLDTIDPSATRRSIVLGIKDSDTRARLLARGYGDVVEPAIGLAELETRARRVAAAAGALPRAVNVGPLLLDLLHRDARRGPTWLGLHPREFGLLWRLAEEPGTPVTRRTLLQDVWRIHHEPDTNSVEVHVSRLRGKLALAGCADLVRTASTGGYRLEVQEGPAPMTRQAMSMMMSS